MLTSELSSYVYEIPNDDYGLWCALRLAVQHSVKSTASRLVDAGKQCEANSEHQHALSVWCDIVVDQSLIHFACIGVAPLD